MTTNQLQLVQEDELTVDENDPNRLQSAPHKELSCTSSARVYTRLNGCDLSRAALFLAPVAVGVQPPHVARKTRSLESQTVHFSDELLGALLHSVRQGPVEQGSDPGSPQRSEPLGKTSLGRQSRQRSKASFNLLASGKMDNT